MKIISWNVNGIRAAYRNGGLQEVEKLKGDIYCFQEIKVQYNEFPPNLFLFKNYLFFINSAIKSGYSGTAIYTKEKPTSIETKLGLKRFDEEGRFLKLIYKNFVLINIYLPHGARDKSNLSYKLKAYNYLLRHLKSFKNQNIILIGDFNIAHQEIDLARPKQNKNNIMFTLEERRKISELINVGFIDTFRKFHPKQTSHYTWWPYFANARQRNLGWRIDYCFVTRKFLPKIKEAFIFSAVRGSDHCPIGIEF